jgi:hypothetical protein
MCISGLCPVPLISGVQFCAVLFFARLRAGYDTIIRLKIPQSTLLIAICTV